MEKRYYLSNGVEVILHQKLKGRFIVEPIINYEMDKGVPMKIKTDKLIVVSELFDSAEEKVEVEEEWFQNSLPKGSVEYRDCVIEKLPNMNSYWIHFPFKPTQRDYKSLTGIESSNWYSDYCVTVRIALALNPNPILKSVIAKAYNDGKS